MVKIYLKIEICPIIRYGGSIRRLARRASKWHNVPDALQVNQRPRLGGNSNKTTSFAQLW
jgi:hypothetical protein